MPELWARVPTVSGAYLDQLRAAWQLHLVPRAQDAPSVVSTFAGCGGSSLGYSMAGYHELLAVEWDANAAETFRRNFPGVPVYHGDIGALSVEEALNLAGIQAGELDVFDGSPPCQGFSTNGKRNFDDERNQLFRQYVRLLRGFRPKLLVMENVSGMVKGKMKLIFAEILRELKDSGYRVKARLLNAKFHGVPQSRERMIFLGVREDLGFEPTFPAPMQSRPITAGEALVDVVNDAAERETLLAAGLKYAAYKNWRRIPPRRNQRDIGLYAGYSARKWHPDRPGFTIVKNDGNVSMHGAMHWSERRRFTAAEFKRFGSFPDEFEFGGEWKDAVARIGNSVPPLFMKSIASHLRTLL